MSNTITTTRTINASPEQVFKAWTHPHYLAKWWGPKDFKNTFQKFDLRPGGEWNFIMHGPNGANYPNSSTFVEISVPEKIVFNHVSNPVFQVVATFQEAGGQTKLTFEQIFKTSEDFEKLKGLATGANEQNIDRLEAVVGDMILDRSDREFTTTRMFDAPAETIMAAWTDQKMLSQWWGPSGFSITTHSMEVKPGGLWRFLMHSSDGTMYPNRIEYTEVVEPSLLAFTHGSDQEPEQFKTVLHLEKHGDQTKLMMRSVYPTPQALDVVKKTGAVDGARQTLERLAGFLAKNKKT